MERSGIIRWLELLNVSKGIYMFCKHDWKMVSETVTKSKFEVAIGTLNSDGNIRLPWQLSNADRKFIQIIQCNKCGKLKRFVEDI